MAIPRSSASSTKQDATRPSRVVAQAAPAFRGVGTLASKADEDAMLEANQWGDHDAGGGLDATQPRGVVLTGTVSQVAVLTRELKALETRYFRTRELLDKAAERSDALRGEMTKCRAQSSKAERENAKLRHLLDRLQGEKRQLEQQAISNRDYAKKIEHKFFAGAPKAQTQTLVQSNVELGGRVKSLERELAQRDDAIQTQLGELKAANDKAAILKRALETRFEELALNGSLHNGVLFELARLQDQNAGMALQLGEERKTCKAVEAKLEHARAKHVELEEHLVVRETWLASLEHERAQLSEQLAASESDRQTGAFEKATLLKFIQEQAEAKFQLEAELKRVQDAQLADLEAFHGKLQLAMDDKQKLQTAANEQLVKLERARLETQQLDKAYKAEQHTAEELRARQHEMFLEIQRLQEELRRKDDDVHAVTDVCRQLQATVDAQRHEEQTLRAKVDELEAFVTALEQEIGQRKDEEAALRTAMETALRDLEVLSKQRNDAARAMNEAVTISASSLDEQQALEAKVETQRKQLEQLKHAKNLLQNAMLEQLSALRKQLQVERLQRIEAEAKLKQHRGVEMSFEAAQQASRLPSTSRNPSSGDEMLTREAPPCSDADELQPLPPPEISLPSPLPPHLAMFQQQLPPRGSEPRSLSSKAPESSSSSSSSSSCSSDEEPCPCARSSPPRRGLASATTSNRKIRTPERTTSVSSSMPSPSDNLSLLELAGEI